MIVSVVDIYKVSENITGPMVNFLWWETASTVPPWTEKLESTHDYTID